MSKILRRLHKAVKYIRDEVYAELPVQQIDLLLTIADEEGLSMNEIGAKLGMLQGSVSRNAKMLSSFLRKGEHGEVIEMGHGLIELRPNPYNWKERAVYLSPKGKEVLDKLEKTLTAN